MNGISLDVAQWFVSIPALAAVIASLVALIRKHLLPLDGKLVIILSLVVGLGLGYGGHLLGYLGDNWLVFGLMAALTASGGVDVAKGLTKGKAEGK